MTHVIFDIGGVLIDYDIPRLAGELSARSGQDAGRLLPFFTKEAVHAVETGRMDPEDFFHQTLSPLLPGMSYEGWIAAFMDHYSLNEPGWALLEDARAHGRAVSVLSNLSPFNQVAIERKFPHFFRATDHNFYSYELGFQKPDPRIYRAACGALGAPPEDCFFLDDLEENVEGARETGMRALRFDNDRIPEIREALGLSAPTATGAGE